MKTNHLKLGVTLLFTLLLSGCGGGGGGSESSTEDTPTVTTSTLTTTTSTTSAKTPTFSSDSLTLLDASGVESVTILCDDKKIQSGSDGKFECDSTPMEFYLGDLYLGTLQEIPVDNNVFTQDIVGEPRGATAHPTVTKISMLLESLDKDSKLSNGISISQDMIDEFNAQSASYSNIADIELQDLEYMIEDTLEIISQKDGIMHTLVTPEDAQVNLTSSVSELPTLTYIQRSIGRVR